MAHRRDTVHQRDTVHRRDTARRKETSIVVNPKDTLKAVHAMI
jgi:hypothetical protein